MKVFLKVGKKHRILCPDWGALAGGVTIGARGEMVCKVFEDNNSIILWLFPFFSLIIVIIYLFLSLLLLFTLSLLLLFFIFLLFLLILGLILIFNLNF